MMAGATIVWLAPVPPDAAQERVISAWGEAHGVTLAAPRDEHPVALTLDEGAATSVDELLESAHDAITERDGPAADHALESAQRILQGHPELPNAAWLMAEVERARSARFRRVPPLDVSAADRAWLRAEALDGGRIAALGEEAAMEHPRGATLVLDPPSGERVWLDGVLASHTAAASREGPHAVVVTWNGAPIWAAWIEAGPGTSPVALPAPSAPPCSVSDMSGVRAGSGAVLPPADVRCGRWIAATTGLVSFAVRFAACEANRCDDLLDWQPAPAWAWAPHPKPSGSRWPAWATWSLVGVGAAAAVGIAAGIAAASQAAPAETHFVSGGLKTP